MAIDKKVYINGNIVTFNMEVTKDKSGVVTSPTHIIPVTVDVTGVTREQMLSNNFSGSSMRVKIQNTHLRPLPEAKLRELAKTGYKTTWSKIDSGAPEMAPVDRLMLLSKDDFIETMGKDLGIPREQAERIYCNKHGLEYVPAPKNGDGNPTQ